MNSEKEARTNQGQRPSKPLTNRGRLLPFRKEHRTNPAEIRDGAHAIRKAYFANGISRRTREGKVISSLEREIAEHRGFSSLCEMPVTLRIKAQLLVGNLIFTGLYDPPADSKNGLRDFHCAQNLVNRLCDQLGLEPAPRPEMSLEEYAAKLEQDNAINEPGNTGESEQEP